ncbi:MAG: hypothetical protein HKM04_02925 [Legionellales bacterium]|nr:hypothetical protein [Legionellales bacterium]
MTKNMTTSIFKKHPKQISPVGNVKLPALFSNFFIAEYKGHYFLQLGLNRFFSNEDEIVAELPAPYQTALQNITEHLAQLKLIPNEKNYCLRGHGILHKHIPDKANPVTTLYDATPLTHFVVELSAPPRHAIEKLKVFLKTVHLPERKHPYTIYQTVELPAKTAENTPTGTSQTTRRF